MAWKLYRLSSRGRRRKVVTGAPDLCIDRYRELRRELEPGQSIELQDDGDDPIQFWQKPRRRPRT